MYCIISTNSAPTCDCDEKIEFGRPALGSKWCDIRAYIGAAKQRSQILTQFGSVTTFTAVRAPCDADKGSKFVSAEACVTRDCRIGQNDTVLRRNSES